MKNSVAYTGMLATLAIGMGMGTLNALYWEFKNTLSPESSSTNTVINGQQVNNAITTIEVITPKTGRDTPYILPQCHGRLKIDVIEPGTLGGIFDTVMSNHSKPVFTCNEEVIPEKNQNGDFHY